MDDFGSGMASFAYLRDFPVDMLKIDGTFIKNIHKDPIDEAMVRAIQNVASVMEMKTVAEFVESPAILSVLERIGVNFAQGFGISKPFPLEELINDLRL